MRPKETFHEARVLEEAGNSREASAQYASVAKFLTKSGKYAEARVVWERAIALVSDSARLYLGLTVSCARMKDEEAAKAALAKFTKLVQQKKQAGEYRARLEKELQSFPALRQWHYEKILETDRTDPEDFLGLAKTWMELEKWGEAQRVLLDALKAKAPQGEVLPLLRSSLEERHFREGLPHLDRFASGELALPDLVLLLQNPHFEPRKKSSGEERTLSDLISALEEEIGIDLEEKPDTIDPLLKEFRQKSERVLAGDPKARLDMGLAFREMGLVQEALEELRKVPEDAACYYESRCLMGEIFVGQGNLLSALEVYQLCRRGTKVTREIRHESMYQLVLIYSQLGDHKQASHVLQELEKVAPGYRDLKHWKTVLQEKQER